MEDNTTPSTSSSTENASSNNEKNLDLDKILEDVLQMNNNEIAGYYNTNDSMAYLRNERHSMEQISTLISIWAIKFENDAQKTPEAEAKVYDYLRTIIEMTDTQNMLGDTLEESIKNLNEILSSVRDCALCKLMVYTKLCIKNCIDNVLRSWNSQVKCPLRDTGLSYLALKEIKEDVQELHKKRCICVHCARFFPRYDEFTCAVSLHEQIHSTRKDIGFCFSE